MMSSFFDDRQEDDDGYHHQQQQEEEEHQQQNLPLENDYYGTLGVGRDATAEDIRQSYRNRSRMFHPDKHSSLDSERQQEAVLIFNRVKRAFDILSDEHLRAVYDTLGQEGLDALGNDLFDDDSSSTRLSRMQIILRSKTPKEIREEYEDIQKEKAQRKLQQRSNPKTTWIIGINATEVFDYMKSEDDYDDSVDDEDEDDDQDTGHLPNIEVSSLSVAGSIDIPLSLKESSTLSGHLATTNGRGSGQFGPSYRRLISDKSWIELQLLIGRGPVAVLKGFRSLGEKSHVTSVLQLPFLIRNDSITLVPSIDVSLGRSFSKNFSGEVKGSLGPRANVSSHVVYLLQGRNQVVFSTQVGIRESFVALFYHHRFQDANNSKVKFGGKVGTKGVNLEYGVETKSSTNSVVGASVSLGIPSGVTLKIRFSYASQSFVFDILLNDEVLPSAVFYGTVIPIVSYACIKKLIIDPYQSSEEKRDNESRKKQQECKLIEKKKEASAVISLWSQTFDKIVSQETACNGLLIVTAFYGKSSLVSSMRELLQGNLLDEDELQVKLADPVTQVIDVRISLQCQVRDSRLSLPSISKANLLGFFDPCFTEDKLLFIRYRFRGKVSEATFDDTEVIELPRKEDEKVTTSRNTTQES